ncbi:hypothetical protein RHSIM_RhsimUnG0135700 [Rhododendron simsii]|uniref:RING-type domain-containing protein n=1 Tax=Rhododendron simsii TaxID=118357 RepID=A0A834L4R1_RHOSS|nr:hypothetical protein RHSIM_RhsimUnG0135700 [Rhododendron simsii]
MNSNGLYNICTVHLVGRTPQRGRSESILYGDARIVDVKVSYLDLVEFLARVNSEHNDEVFGNFCSHSPSILNAVNMNSRGFIEKQRRMEVDKIGNDENKSSLHWQSKEGKGKALLTSTSRGNDVVDLTKQSGPAEVLKKAFPNGASERCQTGEIRKGPISVNGFSPLYGIANSSTMAHNAYKGKERMDATCIGGSGNDRGKGISVDSVPNVGKSLVSIPSFRVRGPKRLVRNGCISPHITEKANQLAENRSNGSTDVQIDNGAPDSDSSSSLIRELVVSVSLLSSQVFLACGHSLTSNEEVSGTCNANGWRSTRNRSKQVNPSLSDQGQLLSRTQNDQSSVNLQNENSMERRDNGSGSRNWPGPSAAARTSSKRQKHNSASSNHSETSTSLDSEIMFLGSSVEPSNSRSTRSRNSHSILNPIIEIEESPPVIRRGSRNRLHGTSNSDSHAREIQLEADEMLARELQEKLYNEAPGVGNGEIDAHIALALQQEETSQRTFSNIGIFTFKLAISNSACKWLWSYLLLPRFRLLVTLITVSLLTGINGALRMISSRDGNEVVLQALSLIWLPYMDLGIVQVCRPLRMHILEALEAFSDMGVTGNFHQAQNAFNENDYETLLALDENNHLHGGASLDRINMLPQSTVQGNNFDETCAICLDTPTTGDTIRHLPCLHKFHKDCIDPWLRRRTSCPVCKCSIT